MKNLTLSFTGLLSSLINQSPRVFDSPDPTNQKIAKLATTIRLDESIRLYYEAQASNLGISIQECIAMTLHAVMRASCEPQAAELERQADRFFELFASHNIPMTEIPELLMGVTTIQRQDLLSKVGVLNKYDSHLVAKLSELFLVSESWLKGLQTRSFDVFSNLYKNANGFARYLAYLKKENRRIRLFFVVNEESVGYDIYESLLVAAQRNNSQQIYIEVIIEIEKLINGVYVKTYEVLNESLTWNYHKCRYDMKAIMMFCDRTRIPCDGIILNRGVFKSLFSDSELAATAMSSHYKIWHPDHFVWNDERNTEIHELPTIKEFYTHEKLDTCEIAVTNSWRISDWKRFLMGDNIKDLIKPE